MPPCKASCPAGGGGSPAPWPAEQPGLFGFGQKPRLPRRLALPSLRTGGRQRSNSPPAGGALLPRQRGAGGRMRGGAGGGGVGGKASGARRGPSGGDVGRQGWSRGEARLRGAGLRGNPDWDAGDFGSGPRSAENLRQVALLHFPPERACQCGTRSRRAAAGCLAGRRSLLGAAPRRRRAPAPLTPQTGPWLWPRRPRGMALPWAGPAGAPASGWSRGTSLRGGSQETGDEPGLPATRPRRGPERCRTGARVCI